MSDNLIETPIARRKTYELVADRLLELIAARRLQPGDPVPSERELVEAYRVGRSSVREALRMLESRGLIAAQGSGAFAVAHARNTLNQSLGLLLSVDEADFHELFEVRRTIEVECAGLAASRRRDSDLAAMTAAIEQMDAGLSSEEAYIAADLRFHLTIAEATGNRVFAHLMYAIRDQVRTTLGTVYRIPQSAERSLDQHRRIAEAIRLRRSDEARAEMHDHIGRVERELESLTERSS